METNKKIGILGGTFNPPHYGHLYICKDVYKEFLLDEVWLMPVGQPPHKKLSEVARKEDRAAMTKLLAGEAPFLAFCDIEVDREGYTYTVDTLRTLKNGVLKNDTIYYIIGTDTLFCLDSWKDVKDVLPLAQFVCVLRPGDDMPAVQRRIEWFLEMFDKKIWLAHATGPEVSSTEIRLQAKEGQSLNGMVPASIEQYIKEHHLYEHS